MEKFILSLLCNYLAWVVLRPMIPFLKFLEVIKVVKYADKICQNPHSNGFFRFAYYVHHMFKHIKERNSIDSESKTVKRNADHQNCLTMCFYMLL